MLAGSGDSGREGKEAAGGKERWELAWPFQEPVRWVHEDSVGWMTHPSWVKQMPQKIDINSTHWQKTLRHRKAITQDHTVSNGGARRPIVLCPIIHEK